MLSHTSHTVHESEVSCSHTPHMRVKYHTLTHLTYVTATCIQWLFSCVITTQTLDAHPFSEIQTFNEVCSSRRLQTTRGAIPESHKLPCQLTGQLEVWEGGGGGGGWVT